MDSVTLAYKKSFPTFVRHMEEADYVIVEFMNREHGRVEIETGFNNVAHLDFKDNEMEFDITVTITPRK